MASSLLFLGSQYSPKLIFKKVPPHKWRASIGFELRAASMIIWMMVGPIHNGMVVYDEKSRM